ncbi:hypothetical protein N665_0666s0007 [Sinapis alba]|nr:hypothetical protein N665_0666s0007 [Sinapis alba]
MDQNMNDFPESDTPFSFEQLLYGDDWERWDTYPSVDVNTNLLHAMAEMNHDGLTIEPNPFSVIYPMEETFEQWLETMVNEPFEIPSYEELNFTYEELLLISEQIGDVGTGLDADVIDGNLNRRRYEDRSGEAEKCVICLDELKYNDDASKLACGHDFHFECIKNWLMVKNDCPLCKQQAL